MQEGDPGDGEGDEGDDAGDGGGDVWAFGWGSLSVQGADLSNVSLDRPQQCIEDLHLQTL